MRRVWGQALHTQHINQGEGVSGRGAMVARKIATLASWVGSLSVPAGFALVRKNSCPEAERRNSQRARQRVSAPRCNFF